MGPRSRADEPSGTSQRDARKPVISPVAPALQLWRIEEARDAAMSFEQLVRRADVAHSLEDAIEAGQPITATEIEEFEEAEAMQNLP